MPTAVALNLLGIVVLGYVVRSWLGRSRQARAWADRPLQQALVLGALPALGLLTLGGGLNKVFGDVLLPLTSIMWLIGIISFFFMFYTPRWWGPRWFHRMENRQR